MSAAPLRVMLVDDHQVVRDGIKLLLSSVDDVVVCAEAATARDAVTVAAQALPDVIVMDVRLSDGSGIEATRDIRAARPQTQVLMLTSFADDEALFASIMAGASGYVSSRSTAHELLRAIRAVGAGQSLLDPAVTKGVLDRLRKHKQLVTDEKLARLSPQEERILGRVAEGLTNGQIAAELGLAEKTVKNYVSSILAKLEVARRAEAAAYLAATPPSPAAPEMESVEVDGLRIAYERAGHGPARPPPRLRRRRPHDLALPARSAQRRAHRHRLGRPGSRRLLRPPRVVRHLGYADALAGFITRLGLESPHVAGLSFGGILALALSGRHPGIPRT